MFVFLVDFFPFRTWVFFCVSFQIKAPPVTLGFLEVDVSELSRLEMPIQAAVRNMRYRGLDQVRFFGWEGWLKWGGWLVGKGFFMCFFLKIKVELVICF